MRRLALNVLMYVVLALPCTAQPVFTDVTHSLPPQDFRAWGASWTDVDQDGQLELFVGGTDGPMLLRFDGSVFSDITDEWFDETTGMLGHCWGDFNNDGFPDLLTTGGSTVLYENEGGTRLSAVNQGPFADRDANRGWSCDWGDYDEDGRLDVIIAHAARFVGSPVPNHLYRQPVAGQFERVTDGPVVRELDSFTIPSWIDFDLDGDLDLSIGSGPADGSVDRDYIFRNLLVESGSADFERVEGINIADALRDGQVMNWIDPDNDGDWDLFVTSYFGRGDEGSENPNAHGLPPQLYVQESEGEYARVASSLTQTTSGNDLANTWGDMDNDGDIDVFIASSRQVADAGYDRLYLNDSRASFTAFTSDPLTVVPTTSSGATLGDYDRDGDLDLFVTSISGSAPQHRLFRNDLNSDRSWFTLTLAGHSLGAVVYATADINGERTTQMRRVSAQNTFAGQNSPIVHFGLGDASVIDRLRIVWPSGAEQTVDGVGVDQHASIRMGEPFGGVLVPTHVEPPVTQAFTSVSPYPNPSRSHVIIPIVRRLVSPSSLTLTVSISDLSGRLIRTLDVDLSGTAGRDVAWDGRDANGQSVASGIYLVRMDSGGIPETRRVTLLR